MRRLIVLLVAACSSSSPSSPPASTPPPTQRPAAESLERGKRVEKPIHAGQSHRYRVELGAGMVATGVVTQKGVDLVVVTFDASGKQVQEFDSPNGDNGPEPFHIQAKAAGAYDVEVRPFVVPPATGSAGSAAPPATGSAGSAAPPATGSVGSAAPLTTGSAGSAAPPATGSGSSAPPAAGSAGSAASPATGSAAIAAAPAGDGTYEVVLDDIVTAAVYEEQAAKLRISSARIREVWLAVRAGRKEAVDKLWTELKGKSPIVEPYPDDPSSVLVTFALRSKTPYVGMFGGPAFREQPLVRLGDTDLWYLTARMPAKSYFSYAFVPADSPPDFHRPYRSREQRSVDERFAKRLIDPNNPKQEFGLSRVEIPGPPEQPWAVVKPDVAKGTLIEQTLDSAALGEKRRIGVYTPAGYDPKGRYPLVIAFDGDTYGLNPAVALMPLPTILDNLIAAKQIPPVVAVLVHQQGKRDRDLTGSTAFTEFLVKELVPKLRAEFRAGLTPSETLVTGSSFGGLCSTFTAFHHPEVFGHVLSNSGAYGYRAGAVDHDVSEFTEGGDLIKAIAKSPKLPLRFYLDAGLFEGDLLTSNRHLRDVLIAKGYELTYAEFPGAHEYSMWRGTISDGLIALLGPRVKK